MELSHALIPFSIRIDGDRMVRLSSNGAVDAASPIEVLLMALLCQAAPKAIEIGPAVKSCPDGACKVEFAPEVVEEKPHKKK